MEHKAICFTGVFTSWLRLGTSGANGPQLLPGWEPQATIWLLYVLLIGLTALSMRAGRADALASPVRPGEDRPVSWASHALQRFLATFAACSLFASIALARLALVAFAIVRFVRVITGCVLFARSALAAWRLGSAGGKPTAVAEQ